MTGTVFDAAARVQAATRDLAANPHRVELLGDPASLDWPDLCPNCGAKARERLRVGKVFTRGFGIGSDLPNYQIICWAAIPFCSACIALHRSEAQPMTMPRRLLTGLLNQMALPMIFAGAAALFCAKEAAAALPDTGGAAVMGVAALVLGLVAVLSGRKAWADSAPLRVPPQTSVTLACDFSDDVSAPFDPPRHIYAIRDAAFADAFKAANPKSVWDPASPCAEQGRYWRRLGAAVLILAAAAGLIWNLFAN